MIAKEKESRADARADFEYDVRYKIITREELNITRKNNSLQNISALKELKINPIASDNTTELSKTDQNLAEFLLRIDGKLDRIIHLLGENRNNNDSFFEGIGKNISASGMNIILEKPVEKGEILFAKLILSEQPFICIDVYGEIVRVTTIKDKDIEKFQTGISFIYTDPSVQEKIVSCVFRQQRREIQKKQN
ncbi:MAG: hypothetical protein QG578_545 [Thermodesulfobacteriota bacterium]|nr:hypothetical protein [Thermodesulfobacteriota bacterium]